MPDDLTRDVELRSSRELPAWVSLVGPPGLGEPLLADDREEELAQQEVVEALRAQPAPSRVKSVETPEQPTPAGRIPAVARTESTPEKAPALEPSLTTAPLVAGPSTASPRPSDRPPNKIITNPEARRRPLALELFSGSGRLAAALQKLGWDTREYDLSLSAEHDLMKTSLQRKIISSIECGEIDFVHLGPPCSSFSVARTPPVRNRQFPYGVPVLSEKDREKLRVGNALALFSLRVMKTCLKLEVPCSLEQPATSWMLRLPPFERAARQLPMSQCVVDYCAYGMPWRKRTAIWSVHLDLSPMARRCPGGHAHQVLRGAPAGGKSWTLIAQPYPPGLVKRWAGLINQRVLSSDEPPDNDANSLVCGDCVRAPPRSRGAFRPAVNPPAN